MEKPTEALEETHMAQAEKTAHSPAGTTQNGGTNVVTLGPRDSLHGRLDIQGDLRVHGTVEGELKASGDVAVESSSTVQASIEGANVTVRGQVTGNVTARRRLTLGGSGKLNGDVKVGRLTVEDGATLNGNVAMATEKQG
jgi:cytoskeletal protein CcmA (bactofilin family)